MKINIIDPTSTEFNRGSFCYAPYLMYNGISEGVLPLLLQMSENVSAKPEITFYETFKAEDLDTVQDADIHIVCLWSYPQIEAAMLLARVLPFTYGKRNVYFVGYSPLIQILGLPHVKEACGFDPLQNAQFLKVAMLSYPKYYGHFSRLLLSDCDMHLKSLEEGQLVHPLFTTYGCPNGCAFCPSTENCGRTRIHLSEEQTFVLLQECTDKGIHYIHFTDEDFFYSPKRAFNILQFLRGKEMHLIALGSSDKVLSFIQTYGAEIFSESGLEVIEIGFESASESISENMGAGKSADSCRELARIQHTIPVNIFWLVQTFFPGETITSLNETGRFMLEYGFSDDEVVGRLKTNGTKGGLGQYFQPYHGLDIYTSLLKDGVFLTERPIRLLPSYIPTSFLDSVVTKFNTEHLQEALRWIDIYGLDINLLPTGLDAVGQSVKSLVLPDASTPYVAINNALIVAILARMQVIQ